MLQDLEQSLQKFALKLTLEAECPNEDDLQALLSQVQQTLPLDMVCVMDTISKPGQIYCPCCSASRPDYEVAGNVYPLPDSHFTDLYDADGLSERHPEYLFDDESPEETPDSLLQYGLFHGDTFWGAVLFWREHAQEWSEEERLFLCKLGRCVRSWLSMRYVDSGEYPAQKLEQAQARNTDVSLLVSVWDDHYQRLYPANREIPFALSGESYSAMIAQSVYQFVDEDYQEEVNYRLSGEYMLTHLSSDFTRYHVDFTHQAEDMPRYYRLSVTSLVISPEGLPSHTLVTLQDITTQVRERDLNSTAFALLRREYSQICLIDLNHDSYILLHSSDENLSGYSQNQLYTELLQGLAENTVRENYREDVYNILSPRHLSDMLNNGIPKIEFSCQRAGHENGWIQISVLPLDSYSPEDARAMWFIRNITADQARETEEMKKILDDNAALSSALSVEKQYRLALMADSYFCFTFDVSGDGMIKEKFFTKDNKDLLDIITGQEPPVHFETFFQKWKEKYNPVFSRETAGNIFTISFLRDAFLHNERIIDVEVKLTPPLNSSASEFMEFFIVLSEDELTGHIMACVIGKDISELRRMEVQARIALKEAYEVAENASRAKSEFLSRMSHDIRTPMNAIIGMTAIAMAHIQDRDRVEDCLQKIGVSSRHLLSLINEVLDMSKIESGKVDLNEEPFDLSDLIENLTLMVRPQINAKRHTFTIHLNHIMHEKLIGDSLRIQQSFVNLVSNAVKYTPDGGCIDLIITEKPCRQSQFSCYEFIFQDNGIGMSPEFMKRIFEPFSRAEDTRVNKIQGTGLGMAITHNLVRMMNGNIKVESKLGEGSRFIVTIFLRFQDDVEDVSSYEEFENLPVLFVDDDPGACVAACDILNSIGMKSEYACSRQEAIDKVKARCASDSDDEYFAVIINWEMPNMDVREIMREIRHTAGRDTPIIVISTYNWSDIELDARAAGANAFISKPLFKSRFVNLFHSVLNQNPQSGGEDPLLILEEQSFKGKRVLLVEDNALNTEIANEILTMADLSVENAENGKRAVEIFTSSLPGYYNLIFMDVQMPLMNGYDATRAIRASEHPDAKTIPIIAMTANAFIEDVEAAMESGMNGHIAKPLDFDQLTLTLKKWIH